MRDSSAGYEHLEQRIREWAGEQGDVAGVVVIGSRARTDRPADAYSDLDLLLFTTDPDRYVDGDDWIDALGDPILTFVEGTATGDRRERRVLFEGGLDVDFVPIAVSEVEGMIEDGVPADVATVFARGVRVLHDGDGLVGALTELDFDAPDGPTLPSESTFAERVADFWYHALWTAKKLARGELWTAKGCLDGYLKWECLLPMIEWHAVAANDVEETWHEGRFLESWADDRVVADLADAFAHYDGSDAGRALAATMDLFAWVARETAETMGFDYPEDGERRTRALVDDVLVQGDGSL